MPSLRSEDSMPPRRFRSLAALLGLLALTGAAVLIVSGRDSLAQKREFQRKQCLDCHQDFAKKVLTRKDLHPSVKDGNCETCHLRHGIVPKLLLKQNGNELCLSCHDKAKIGLDKQHVHTAVTTGKCTTCHDPHGSNGAHLLPAAGPEACFR